MVTEDNDSRNENLSTNSAEEDVRENKGANLTIEEKLNNCHEMKILEEQFKNLEQQTKSPEISKTIENKNFREITAIVELNDELVDQEYLRKIKKWVTKPYSETKRKCPENRIIVILKF